mgnify:CR=1 FL=1
MDYAFERDWQALVKLMMDRFGEEPDVTSMVFAVGLQEAGQGARRYKKDEKINYQLRTHHLLSTITIAIKLPQTIICRS